MTSPSPSASISLVLLGADRTTSAPEGLARAVAEGRAAEMVCAGGPFEDLAPVFADAVAACAGGLVLVVTPDTRLTDEAWAALAAAIRADPDADAFRLALKGLASDPGWRGRRCRSHGRNLESLRFAHLIAPGALLARREPLLAAARRVSPEAGADWWREVTERLAAAGRFVRLDAAARRARRLPGEPPSPGFAALPHRSIRVLVLGQIEVSTSLYFDFLQASPGTSVAFRPLTRLGVDAPHLADADLVVLVRELHRFWDEGVIRLLDELGTPYVYFTDDNFLALGSEGAGPTFYMAGRMRRALAGAAEVWASTPALAEAMGALHPRARVWGPALDPLLIPRAAPRPEKLTLAVAGGDFRVAGLEGPLVRRLAAIAERQALRLVLTEAAARALAPRLPGVEIVAMPPERSFRQFVRQWRRFGVDILLHPAGVTANAPYKCPTAVIVAGYLGAVPVVADEPAYEGWSEADGVLKLGAEAAELAEAAARVREDVWRSEMAQRLSQALAARFGAGDRLGVLDNLPPPDRSKSSPSVRQVLASPAFAGRRAVLALAHTMRRFSLRR